MVEFIHQTLITRVSTNYLKSKKFHLYSSNVLLFFFLFPQRTSSPYRKFAENSHYWSGHNTISHWSREILQGNAEIGQRRFSQSHGTIRKGHGQSRLNPSGLHFLHVITVPKVVFSFLFCQATGFFGNIGAPGQVGAFCFHPWSASRQSQAR